MTDDSDDTREQNAALDTGYAVPIATEFTSRIIGGDKVAHSYIYMLLDLPSFSVRGRSNSNDYYC